MAVITVHVPKHLLITANHRLHHMPKAEKVKTLRSAAYWTARAAKQPKLERASLVITVHWPPLARNRDRLNLAPTIKAIVDGFVDAGVLPDDDDKHLISETLRTADDRCKDAHGAVLDFDFQEIA